MKALKQNPMKILELKNKLSETISMDGIKNERSMDLGRRLYKLIKLKQSEKKIFKK